MSFINFGEVSNLNTCSTTIPAINLLYFWQDRENTLNMTTFRCAMMAWPGQAETASRTGVTIFQCQLLEYWLLLEPWQHLTWLPMSLLNNPPKPCCPHPLTVLAKTDCCIKGCILPTGCFVASIVLRLCILFFVRGGLGSAPNLRPTRGHAFEEEHEDAPRENTILKKKRRPKRKRGVEPKCDDLPRGSWNPYVRSFTSSMSFKNHGWQSGHLMTTMTHAVIYERR